MEKQYTNRDKCHRCSYGRHSWLAVEHCNGDHRSVLRPGEKSAVIRCKCSCNDYGQVQAKKGHTKFTMTMSKNAMRDYRKYWGGKRGR